MLPCNPDPPSTPKCKGTQSSPHLTSGQKGPLPAKKPSQEKQLDGSPVKALPCVVASSLLQEEQLSNAPCPRPVSPLGETPFLSPDPISPISSIADNGPNKPVPRLEDPNYNDPITATPPSQRNRPGNQDFPNYVTNIAARQHEQTLQEGQGAKGASDPVTDPHHMHQSASSQNQHGSQRC